MSVQSQNKYILEFAESAKTSAQSHLESLINHATQHTSVFQFTELLAVPNVKELQNSPLKKAYDLLNLFAYSNYSAWFKEQDKYPNLNALQIKKLRILTLVSLAESEKVLGFELMKHELGLAQQDELEDLIIESIYAGVLSGKISQSDRVLRVSNVISRDVRLSDVNSIKKKLQRILDENKRVQKSLTEKITELNKDKTADIESKALVQQNRQLLSALAANNNNKDKKASLKKYQDM